MDKRISLKKKSASDFYETERDGYVSVKICCTGKLVLQTNIVTDTFKHILVWLCKCFEDMGGLGCYPF